MELVILIQAHHENWGGGKSYCLSIVKGQPVIAHVLKKLKRKFPSVKMVLSVPDEKENVIFEPYAKENNCYIYYGSKANILERFLGTANMIKCDAFIRVIGEHFFIDTDYVESLKKNFEFRDYDIVTPPLDYDPKFGAEVVKLRSLFKVEKFISKKSNGRENILSNPLQFMTAHPEIFTHFIDYNVPQYSREEILEMRNIAKEIYLEAYEHNSEKSELSGDRLRMHYEIAKNYLTKKDKVLDIACGEGWGSAILAQTARKVVGADISAEFIKQAKNRYNFTNLSFETHNALQTSFENESFDAVISMETIEHMEDDKRFLSEMHRIIRTGGFFIISTPQSSTNFIPLIPYHIREYSLKDFKELLSEFFHIKKFYSFRSNLMLEGDLLGTGMMAVCEKTGNI